jgi:hypothetical protein
MKKFKKNSVLLLFLFVLLLNTNEMQARAFYPLKKNTVAMTRSKSDDPHLTILALYAGAAAGGKQNTCYFLKSRLIVMDKINFDGALFYNMNGDKLYNANFSFGKNIAFSTGVEWGDRTYFVNKDSTLEKIKFKNSATGEYASYNSFTGVTFPEKLTAYAFGISINAQVPTTNYWRGKGKCWTLLNFKFEGLYAPTVNYSKSLDVTTEGNYEETTETYLVENATVKHWGFRLVMDMRLSSKIGFMMETGMRPGVKYEINPEGRFSNGYLRMGVLIGISVGGRKALKKATENE